MMTNDKKLAEELLRKNGLKPGKASDQTLRRIQQILERELKRAGQLKRACTIVWSITVVWPVIAFLLWILTKLTTDWLILTLNGFLMLGWYVLVPCAIGLTMVTHLSIKTATMYQTQASLVNISEQLKRQSAESSVD